jgi:hypothetical protein
MDHLDPFINHDFFRSEAEQFERDVHMLILTTLYASVTALKKEVEKGDSEIRAAVEQAGSETGEWLAQEHADLLIEFAEQERFLHNMALVALLCRLTHTLKAMARSAEPWFPTRGQGEEGDDEFKALWSLYRDRFGICFSAKYIQFISPLRVARNYIVHRGSEANPLRPFEELVDAGDEGLYDPQFSQRYPQFVFGEGYGAEIQINEEQLDKAISSSVLLVKHAAERLRAAQLQRVRTK